MAQVLSAPARYKNWPLERCQLQGMPGANSIRRSTLVYTRAGNTDERTPMSEDFRIEHDSMGEMRVPAHALWGAQTQRSYENFRIGTEIQPEGIIRAFAQLKKAAA